MTEELAKLRAENAELRALLAKHSIPLPKRVAAETIADLPRTVDVSPLSPNAKIKLFGRFFHGRQDVYPIRWESQQSGKAGYSPVCANEWRRGISEKPRIKCSECNHSLYVPVSDQVIFRHLKGEITAGVYLILADDRCYFLAIDFDDADWREGARAVVQTCIANKLPAALEISRSGKGAHLWLFSQAPCWLGMFASLALH